MLKRTLAGGLVGLMLCAPVSSEVTLEVELPYTIEARAVQYQCARDHRQCRLEIPDALAAFPEAYEREYDECCLLLEQCRYIANARANAAFSNPDPLWIDWSGYMEQACPNDEQTAAIVREARRLETLSVLDSGR